MERIIDPKTCCQVSLVARDIEKIAQRYAELFGVEMPEILHIPPVEEAQTLYRGMPSMTQARLCVFDMGQVCLEIMEPDEFDSSWKEALGDKEVAFHHIGFVVEDLDKAVAYFAAHGCPERHRGHYPVGNTYLLPDSIDQYGILFNLKYEPGNN
ncbi:MAG: VOC family protein [Gemmiger sp.]|nr:VOC family protein [Gemmiger sp.]